MSATPPGPNPRAFATERHAGQVDKSGQPYIGHLDRVARYVAFHGGDNWQVCAAWLHDVVEDTPTTIEEIAATFDNRVAQMVAALTHHGGECRAEYLDRILAVPDAVLVKMGDLYDNTDPARYVALDLDTQRRLKAKYDFSLDYLRRGKRR